MIELDISAPLTIEERGVIDMISTASYEDVSKATGWSRGKIYNLLLRTGARKTENRIRERASDRRRRQMETLAELMGKTVTADVDDYLEALPNDCAQVICTSIPYNVGKTYGDAVNADALPHLLYLAFLIRFSAMASRVLRSGGVLFVQMGSTKDDDGALIPIDTMMFDWLRKAKLTFQSRVIWTAPHGLTPKRRLAERYETALVFSKGEPIFHATPARRPQKQPDKRAYKGPNLGALSGHPLGAWPSNVWDDIGTIGHCHPEKTGHEAQFPLALARRAIQLYSNAGDLVIDPFCGSGTTALAALQTGRAFSGCDLFYQDMREKRLANATPDLVSALPGVSDATIAVWQAEARRIDVAANVIAHPLQRSQSII